MRLHELRIGNYLSARDEPKQMEGVTGISYEEKDSEWIVQINSGVAYLGEYMPILLTEGWLVEFGIKNFQVCCEFALSCNWR